MQSFKYIINNRIDGDFVECGVWKGGNLILLQKLIEKYEIKNKKIFGFDTFDGMQEPSDIDIDCWGNKIKNVLQAQKKNKDIDNIWSFSPIEDVRNNFFKNTTKNNNLILIKGKVEDTLPRLNDPNTTEPNKISEKISILRLDTDWYESTKIELEILYPRLVIGGVLIIDDYGYCQGAKKAVDEYFKDKMIWMHYVDRESRLIIKK